VQHRAEGPGFRQRRPRQAPRAGFQGRHEAAAHQRRDEGRCRPDHDRGSPQGRAAGARPADEIVGDVVADVVQLLLITAAVVYLAMVLFSRRQAQKIQELKRNQDRFRGLTELSADWFWETDGEHRIVWLSGGGPVALFFGGTKAYGRRFW